jgi:cell division protein FtsW (lipid II flippase)
MNPYLPAPRPKRWRRSVYAASLALPFSAMQVWAVMLLLRVVHPDGPAVLAFLLVVAGAVVSALASLRWAWRLGSLEPGTAPRA